MMPVINSLKLIIPAVGLTLTLVSGAQRAAFAADVADRPANLALGEVPNADQAVVRRGYVDSSLGQIHYQRVSPSEGSAHQRPASTHPTDTPPPMYVLLHQVPWSHVYYARAQAALAQRGIHSIAFDTPGYGLSAKPASEPTIAEYASALREAITRLELGRVMLVGHHTGATLSVEIARQESKDIVGLVLHGVPIYTADEAQARLSAPHWDQTLKADGTHLSDRWLALSNRVAGTPESLHWSVLSLFLAGEQEWFGHHAVFKYPMAESLRDLKVPAVVFTNRDDLLDFTLDRVKEIRPDWRYRRLDAKSSNMAFDQPQAWVEALVSATIGDQLNR
jgi:pimeloyl-ACP methyl ester carboxylesterase